MRTITELVLATKNAGKVAELQEMLTPLGIKVHSALELNLPDVEETGGSFQANALLKAESACAASGLPALADDSGLCVDALGGLPGVDTAFFGGYAKLLERMETVSLGARKAHFECVLAFCVPGQAPRFFTGRVDGFIGLEAKGGHGFGYDPVFLPEGHTHTFAEMMPHEKHILSHRGRAMAQFMTFLKEGASKAS